MSMGLQVMFVVATILLLLQLGWPVVADRSDVYEVDTEDLYGHGDNAFISNVFRVFKKGIHGSSLRCRIKVPKKRSNNVNKLTPFDVEVVGALGDSLTAAFAAGAITLLGVPFEYKGRSWSIGGKYTLSWITTLPNILKTFNYKLFGFSKRIKWFKKKEAFNRAVTGAKVRDLLGQAQDLVKQMRRARKMGKWKIITIFIGSNDLCDSCKKNEDIVVKNYMRDLKKALRYLRQNVRYAFINLALLLDVSILKPLRGSTCDKVHNDVCSCVNTRAKKVSRVAKAINRSIVREYQYRQPFDTKHFAVVVQPFYSKTKLPFKIKRSWFKRRCRFGGGRKRSCPVPDKSILAPDCFHFNRKTHAIAATYLWNNMLQPVGKKSEAIQWGRTRRLFCPQRRAPYFRTNSNSKLAL